MEEQLITFETAILAKEKGFNWKIVKYFKAIENNKSAKGTCNLQDVNEIEDTSVFSRPTQALLQKWLREESEICVLVTMEIKGYTYIIYKNIGTHVECFSGNITGYHYEKALEAGLVTALNLIK